MRTGIVHNATTIPNHEIGNVILERDAPDPANGAYLLYESKGGKVSLVPIQEGDRVAIVTIEWREEEDVASTQPEPEPMWSFEAQGSENSNAEGWLSVGTKQIQLLAEGPANLIRILIAELRSWGFEPKSLDHYCAFIESERGPHDPWSLCLDSES